ncbi:MAG: aminotransferase class III-fold pyridoxal phosphate-dependent enzyme, partial [Candidatus Delongbacteria bacterium]|nr:aminotransferase class III-fold pyridoxal phosphate-dependent enzyme [Candidatus Delongbacteria bacterium]
AVAIKNIDLLFSGDWRKRVKRIEEQLKNELLPYKNKFSDKVKDIRVLGAIGVIELRNKINLAKVQRSLVDKGVWLRPFGNLLYTMPPYIIDSKDISQITSSMIEIIKNDDMI